STSTPGSRATFTTPSSNRSAAASSAYSIPRSRAIHSPGCRAMRARCGTLFDGEPFPYGIEENRPTLEQFLRYTHEQGIADPHAAPEEIFPNGIMTAVRV